MLCLSVDIDWAHDAVIADLLHLIEHHRAKATWFVTHATPLLADIRAAGRHELGLHPNFNPLLEGATGNARDTLLRLKEIVPEGVSARSHSLTRSSRLAVLFKSEGLGHESNYFVPPVAGNALAPWRDFAGLVQVPIRWEDDVRLIDPSIGEPIEHVGHLQPFVVDVHPIPTYLNTTTPADYERAKADASRPHDLAKLRRPAGCGGSRDRLVALLEAAATRGIAQVRVSELAPGAET
jgi:hypothetical protein